MAERHRKHGLDKPARQMVAFLQSRADHAKRLLVFSHPPRNPISRSPIAAQNLGFRLMRRQFRTFAHPPAAMLAVLERHGLQPIFTHRGIPWQVAGLER
jgi:magnesium-protoporphyrin O-methyltransferase